MKTPINIWLPHVHIHAHASTLTHTCKHIPMQKKIYLKNDIKWKNRNFEM